MGRTIVRAFLYKQSDITHHMVHTVCTVGLKHCDSCRRGGLLSEKGPSTLWLEKRAGRNSLWRRGQRRSAPAAPLHKSCAQQEPRAPHKSCCEEKLRLVVVKVKLRAAAANRWEMYVFTPHQPRCRGEDRAARVVQVAQPLVPSRCS